MNIREIDGKAVLSYFNASTGNMEVRVATTRPGWAPRRPRQWCAPVSGPIRWRACPAGGQPARAALRGYISPGSTLDEVRVFVSQWNTAPRDRMPYRVIQFAVNPFKPWSTG